MDYVFRLTDGRRLVLWSEKNQVIRQLSGGGGNRSQISLRTDFLSDLSAVVMEGKFYYVYQNTSRRVVLALPEEEERVLFGESIEHCRHGGLTLVENGGQLYLFYTAWSPIRERYSLNVCKPLEWFAGEEVTVGGEIPATALLRDEETVPAFQWIRDADGIRIMTGKRCFCLYRGVNGEDGWREGLWCDRDRLEWYEEQAEKADLLGGRVNTYTQEIQRMSEEWERKRLDYEDEIGRMKTINDDLDGKVREAKTRLEGAVTQYNELAEVARQLQIEGKKWRDKYYQETKRKRVRLPEE